MTVSALPVWFSWGSGQLPVLDEAYLNLGRRLKSIWKVRQFGFAFFGGMLPMPPIYPHLCCVVVAGIERGEMHFCYIDLLHLPWGSLILIWDLVGWERALLMLPYTGIGKRPNSVWSTRSELLFSFTQYCRSLSCSSKINHSTILCLAQV